MLVKKSSNSKFSRSAFNVETGASFAAKAKKTEDILTSKRILETLTFRDLSAMPDLCICDSVFTLPRPWEYFAVQNP